MLIKQSYRLWLFLVFILAFNSASYGQDSLFDSSDSKGSAKVKDKVNYPQQDNFLDTLSSEKPVLVKDKVDYPQQPGVKSKIVKKEIRIRNDNGTFKLLEIMIPSFALPKKLLPKPLPPVKSLSSVIRRELKEKQTLEEIPDIEGSPSVDNGLEQELKPTNSRRTISNNIPASPVESEATEMRRTE